MNRTFNVVSTYAAPACLILWLTAVVSADIDSPRPHTVGVGSRATAMAGNQVAITSDFSSLYYNPAGLGFVQAREAHIGLNAFNVTNESDISGKVTETDKQRLRLGSGGLLWSAPVSRGGLAFALGYQSPQVFDNSLSYTYTSGESRDEFRSSSYGQLNHWSFGFGLQIAPGLSGGLTASLVTGTSKTSAAAMYYENGQLLVQPESLYTSYERSSERTYIGYDIRAGVMYRFSESASLGARFVLPKTVRFLSSVEERYPTLSADWSANGEDRGTLKSMYEIALGAAVRLPFAALTPEIGVRGPDPSDTTTSDAAFWKIGGGIGAEVPLFKTGALVRLGYRYDEYDNEPFTVTYEYTDGSERVIERVKALKDQQTISAGLAYVSRGSLSLDLSYAYKFWKTEHGILRESHSLHQVLLAVSLRY